MKDVVDDVHPRRQIVGKWNRDRHLAQRVETGLAVRPQIAFGVRHDDAKHAARLERAAAVAQKRRQVLARLDVLEEMLDADAGGAFVADRHAGPAVPSHSWRRADQLDVDEAVEDLRAAGDVHQRVTHAANLAQPRPPAGQHRVLCAHDPGVRLEAKLIEEKTGNRQTTKQRPAGALLEGQAHDALPASLGDAAERR